MIGRDIRVFALALACSSSGCWTVWHGHTPDRTERVQVVDLLGRQAVLRERAVIGRSYDAIGFEQLRFSADGSVLAYPVMEAGRWRLVVDGVRHRPWHGIGDVAISRDGSHLAYAAEDDDEHWRVVLDDSPGPVFDAIHADTLRFEANDGLLVYVGSRDDRSHLVVNGRVGPAYDGIGPLQFGHRGRVLAYVARDGHGARIVVNGHPSPRLEGVAELVLAADSDRVHAIVQKASGFSLLIDGRMASAVEEELVALIVSRDGAHYACVQRTGARERVRVDGRLEPEYERILGSTLRFSEDGQQLAYVAIDEAGEHVVLDGQASRAYAEIDGPFFTTDGRLLYVGRSVDGSVVEIGDALRAFEQWAGYPVVAESSPRYAFLLRAGDDIAIVSDRGQRRVPAIIPGTLTFDAAGARWGAIIFDRESGALSLAIEGEPARGFDADEVSALAARDPSMILPTHATDEVRNWVRAELAR